MAACNNYIIITEILERFTQVLPSDFGEYLNAFFNAIVVVVFFFLFYFIIENIS